jgi:hypothetical protein
MVVMDFIGEFLGLIFGLLWSDKADFLNGGDQHFLGARHEAAALPYSRA